MQLVHGPAEFTEDELLAYGKDCAESLENIHNNLTGKVTPKKQSLLESLPFSARLDICALVPRSSEVRFDEQDLHEYNSYRRATAKQAQLAVGQSDSPLLRPDFAISNLKEVLAVLEQLPDKAALGYQELKDRMYLFLHGSAAIIALRERESILLDKDGEPIKLPPARVAQAQRRKASMFVPTWMWESQLLRHGIATDMCGKYKGAIPNVVSDTPKSARYDSAWADMQADIGESRNNVYAGLADVIAKMPSVNLGLK